MRSLLSMLLRLAANALRRRPPGEGIPAEPEAYGLQLGEPRCRERCRGVFRSFFAGVETAARRPWSPVVRRDETVPSLQEPFYWEGTALGRSLARALTFRGPISLARGTFSKEEPYAFMKAVGVGFAAGLLRPRSPSAADRAARGLGSFGDLVHDGLGFAIGLFRWEGDLPSTLIRLRGGTGPARLSVLNGLGRSLWFRFMDRPEAGIQAIRGSGEALGLLGGLGLAAAFTFPDELARAYAIADSLESSREQRAFLKGVRIALFVRARDQRELLQEHLGRLEDPLGERARGDLRAAEEAHQATHEDPGYIRLFHERCLETSS